LKSNSMYMALGKKNENKSILNYVIFSLVPLYVCFENAQQQKIVVSE
jgi:hypothetical protein